MTISTVEFSSNVSKFDSNLWGYHFIVPDIIAEKYISGNNRRVLCNVNGSFTVQSALMPSGSGWFVFLNTQLITRYHLAIGDRIHVEISKDTSEYGMEMPEEFAVMLDQDQEGSDFFHQLTPGKQRTLIYIVLKVKNMDSRINKALAILHHLKEVKGKLDFKGLNELIKHYNSLGKSR